MLGEAVKERVRRAVVRLADPAEGYQSRGTHDDEIHVVAGKHLLQGHGSGDLRPQHGLDVGAAAELDQSAGRQTGRMDHPVNAAIGRSDGGNGR